MKGLRTPADRLPPQRDENKDEDSNVTPGRRFSIFCFSTSLFKVPFNWIVYSEGVGGHRSSTYFTLVALVVQIALVKSQSKLEKPKTLEVVGNPASSNHFHFLRDI